LGRIVSIFAGDFHSLGDKSELPINGAHFLTADILKQLISQPWLEALEVFLPPSLMVQEERIAQTAFGFLPPERRGQGALRFYPFYALPEVWSDHAPRAVLCFEAEAMATQRYLRDRFAKGPTFITNIVHTHAHHSFWKAIVDLSCAPAAPFDSFICNSPTTHSSMQRAFEWVSKVVNTNGNPPARLDDISYGVDLDLYQPHDENAKRHARRVLALPTDGRIVLFFGRVTAHNKADLLPLLRCFAQAGENPNHYLVIAGPPAPEAYAQALRDAGRELGLGDRLIVHGEADMQLPSLYFGAADFFVFPGDNLVETWGQTLCEAKATGLPLIVSDWDGLRTHVAHGENGFLIPTWQMPASERLEAFSPIATTERLAYAQNVWLDTDALTDALQMLLNDEELCTKMGARSRAMAEKNYSWPRVMEQWRTLWDELEEIAKNETPEAAQARREYSNRLGVPVPYGEIFADYPTAFINPQQHSVALSQRAKTLRTRQSSLGFYDDIVPMLRREVVDSLFGLLELAQGQPMHIAELTKLCSAQTACDNDLIRFHIGVFLKHDLVELSG
jgi:D-inositol-3-phosphate glycosyltransferase